MPDTIKRAATVIIVREDGAVFWARRPASSAAFANFHVFPGGALEKDETREAAARRETREETGLAVEELLPAGRFLTPPFSPLRFDTWFFVARAPAGAEARLESGELEAGEWIQPREALARWNRDEVTLAPPTRTALEVLAEHPALEAAARELERRSPAEESWPRKIELRPGLLVFPVRTPTLPPATHTNVVLVGRDELVAIDPASPYPEEQAALDGLLDELALEGRRLVRILLTHEHQDHVSGAQHLAERARVPIAASEHVKNALRGKVTVTDTIADGDVIAAGGRRLRAVLTEGHARGHLAYFEETSKTLAAGDMVAGYGWIIIDPPEGDMKTYLESLARLRALGATLLFPSHGPPIGEPTAKLDEYVAHRLAREAKVFAAWEGGARSLTDVVEVAYQDTPAALHGLAARSALAHLLKLQQDGRILAQDARFQV